MTRVNWPYTILIAVIAVSLLALAVEYSSVGGRLAALPWLGVAAIAVVVLVGLFRRELRSERKAAAQAAGGRDRLAAALDAATMGIARYDVDIRLEDCNEAYRALLGGHGVAVEPGARYADLLAAATGATVSCEAGAPPPAGEYCLLDGSWLRFGGVPLAGGGFAGTVVDISEMKHLEQAARTDVERLREYLSAAAGWTWETDVLNRFSNVQPVQPGTGAVDLNWMIGRHPSELIDPADRPESKTLADFWKDLTAHRRFRDVELPLRHNDWRRRIRLSGGPKFDDSGAFLGYRGVWILLAPTASGTSTEKPYSTPRPAEPVPRDDASAGGSGDRPGKPGSVRLLLVDDSRTNRMLAISMLRKMGFEPVAVENGAAAVEAVKEGGFAAVLMDVWMPGMDGFEATAAIRALPGPEKAIPIIAMTAGTDRKDRRRCLDAGMNDFVSKPVDRKILVEVIGRLTGDADSAVVDEASVPEPASDILIDDGVLNQLRIDAGPDLINDFVAAYMLETDGRLNRMAEAAAKGDLAAVAGDAHTLKSSSGTFGARRLHGLASAIEAAAESGDAGAAAELMSGLAALVLETWAAFAGRGLRAISPPRKED